DESELAVGEAKAGDVFLGYGIGVGEENLRRRLLDDGAADGTFEDVARALRGEAHDTIQLPPGLWAILRETLERGVLEQPPELVHPAHQPASIEHLPHEVKEIHRDGSANDVVPEELRYVETDYHS